MPLLRLGAVPGGSDAPVSAFPSLQAKARPAARPPIYASIVPPPAPDITAVWLQKTVPQMSTPDVFTVPVVNREMNGRVTVTPQILAPTQERAAAGPPLARVPIVAPLFPPYAPDATMPTKYAVRATITALKSRIAERQMFERAQAQRNGQTGTQPLVKVGEVPTLLASRVIVPNAARTGTTTAPVTPLVRRAAKAEAEQMTIGPYASARAELMTAPTVQEARAADASGTGQPDATVAAQAPAPDLGKFVLPLAFLGILLLVRK